MKLKVCGMREKENMQNLVEDIHPDWMGLIFYPKSARYVDDADATFIKSLGISKVGVFVNATLKEIEEKINLFDLKVIQLHGEETVDFVRELKEATGIVVFKVFSVANGLDWSGLETYLPYVDYFLFDTFAKSYGGSGKVFDWEILLEYPFDKPFLLSGGLNLEHIPKIIELKSKIPQLSGLDINSRFEMEPAVKDLALIEEFKNKMENGIL